MCVEAGEKDVRRERRKIEDFPEAMFLMNDQYMCVCVYLGSSKSSKGLASPNSAAA